MKRFISSVIVAWAGISLSAVFFAASTWGAPVTEQKASKAAETFIVRAYPAIGQKVAQTVTAFGKSHLAVHKVRPLLHQGRLVGFVADLKPSGYVLLSADDEAPAIKMHADNGAFDNLPPAILKVVGLELAQDLNALAKLRRLHKAIDRSHKQQWSTLLEPAAHPVELAAISPAGAGSYMLTTSWAQIGRAHV